MTRGQAAASETLNELQAAYSKASKEIQGEIRRLYERYGDEYGLTYAEAIKYIDQSDYREWRMSLADYVKRINATGDEQLQRELDTLSTRSRVTRLETVQTAVKVNSSELAQKGEDAVTQLLSDTYTDTYFRAAYDMQMGVGVGSTLEMLAPGTVAKAISYPWSGADYSKRIWDNADRMAATLQSTITQGLIQGKDMRQMTKAIVDATGASVYNAERLVRTETAAVVEAAELKNYADSGVMQYEVLASLDERTCKVCGGLDGKVYDIDKAITAKTCPPFHSNCRCTTTAHFSVEQMDEWERLGAEALGEPVQHDAGERFARDAGGKGTAVPGDLKYEDWFDQYVKADKAYATKVKAYQNHFADLEQLGAYKDRLGKKYTPASIEKFQALKYNDAGEWGVLKAQYRAMGYYDRVVAVEPGITKQVKDVAADVGVQPVGLEYRIKGKDSYLRKVRDDYKQVGNSFEINDILRYTYVAPPGDLADKTLESIERYAEKGYNTVKIKNTWLDETSAYKGINTIIASPGGPKFELQYHTQESFDLKNGQLHVLYEKARVLDPKSDEYIALQEQMFKLSERLTVPSGIEKVKKK